MSGARHHADHAPNPLQLLGREIVQPLDDLNLANLLVSPLIGWDQNQLFDLAYGRGKESLWRVLRNRAGELACARWGT